MARRKNSAALFEVFNENKMLRESLPAAPSSRSHKFWFKQDGHAAVADAPPRVSSGGDPTVGGLKSPLLAPRIAAVESLAPAAETPRRAAGQSASQELAPVAPNRAPRIDRAIDSHSAAVRRQKSSRFHIDPDSGELTLRIRLSVAIVAGFVVVAMIAMGYFIGRRVGAGNDVAAATDTRGGSDDPRVQPSAIDIAQRSRVASRHSGAASSTTDRDPSAAPVANNTRDLDAQVDNALGGNDGPRVIGLNYIIAQSYPNQAGANDACEFLNKNGVSCTVEKGPPGWAADSNWYSVVSTRGFEHIHTNECEALQVKIERLGEKFAGNARFKRFEPHLYRWK